MATPLSAGLPPLSHGVSDRPLDVLRVLMCLPGEAGAEAEASGALNRQCPWCLCHPFGDRYRPHSWLRFQRPPNCILDDFAMLTRRFVRHEPHFTHPRPTPFLHRSVCRGHFPTPTHKNEFRDWENQAITYASRNITFRSIRGPGIL
jgi:hypothetical protein